MGRGRAKGYIVDTNVLVSKKLKFLESLNAELYVTPVVILEYYNWAIRQRNRMLASGEVERARGYERLLLLLPRLLEYLGVKHLCVDLDTASLYEASRLVVERAVNPGDALIAVTAKRLGLGVISLDSDWERLRDYVAELVKPG